MREEASGHAYEGHLSLLKIYLIYFFILLCLGNQEGMAKESRRQHRVPWDWELQAAVSHLVLVLGTELRSSGPSEGQAVLLTPEPSLQPLGVFFF